MAEKRRNLGMNRPEISAMGLGCWAIGGPFEFDDEAMEGWTQKLEAIRQALSEGVRTLAQGALSWIWAKSAATIPIPGFRTVAQVEENAGAMRFGPLSAEAMSAIDDALGRQTETVS